MLASAEFFPGRDKIQYLYLYDGEVTTKYRLYNNIIIITYDVVFSVSCNS